jgi:cytochrome c553
MNKLLTTLFALAVASGTAFAQAPAAPAASAAPAAKASAPAAPAGAKSIEAKVAMCIGCHGIVGYQASFPEVHKVPMISGQSAKYIAASLKGYQTGDRKHPTMRGIAASLTDQDINDIAAYYEQHGKESGKPLPAEPSKKPSEYVAKLLTKAQACVACHGQNFSTPIDGNTPKIAGQHADYLYVTLKGYKYNERPASGRNNVIMAGIAKQFSDAELKALAKYIASLDGELKIKPENKFR